MTSTDTAALSYPRNITSTSPHPDAVARWVRSEDRTVLCSYFVGDESRPTVVLSHGWTCSAKFWQPVVEALLPDFRVVTWDLRGHGRSDRPKGNAYTSHALAMDTKAVVDAATEDGGPVLLVGHSMGAMAAVAWAGRYPGLVKEQVSAVLLASTGIADLTTAGHLVPIPDSLRFLRGVANWIFLATPVPSGPPSPLSHLVVKYTSFAPTAPDDQVSFCEEIIVKCPPIVRSKWARMMGSLNLDKEAEALTVPTSVLYGTLDRLTPPDQALHLAEVLPNLDKLIEIPGVGHMTPIEATDELASEIRRLSNNYRQAEVPPSK